MDEEKSLYQCDIKEYKSINSIEESGTPFFHGIIDKNGNKQNGKNDMKTYGQYKAQREYDNDDLYDE